MKRALAFALGVPAVALTFVWAGCALVIDLGDEVGILPGDSSLAPADGASTDAGSDAAESDGAPKCGVQQRENPSCASCFDEGCCGEGLACAGDPVCVSGLQAIQDCMGQPECIFPLLADASLLGAVAFCSQKACSKQCEPNADCRDFGRCASILFPEAGPLRTSAVNVVLQNDGPECVKQRELLDKTFDAAACP